MKCKIKHDRERNCKAPVEREFIESEKIGSVSDSDGSEYEHIVEEMKRDIKTEIETNTLYHLNQIADELKSLREHLETMRLEMIKKCDEMKAEREKEQEAAKIASNTSRFSLAQKKTTGKK